MESVRVCSLFSKTSSSLRSVASFFNSLFRRYSRSGVSQSQRAAEGPIPKLQEELFHIDFDMMLKGSIYRRRREVIRQYGVTVNGSTRLVTSGDTVDLETYKALLAAGAIRPAPNYGEDKLSINPSFVDFTTIESSED